MLKLLNGPVTFFLLLLFSPLSLFRHVFLLLEKNVDNEMQKIRIKDRLVVTRNTNKFWLRISKTSDYLLLDISFWLSLSRVCQVAAICTTCFGRCQHIGSFYFLSQKYVVPSLSAPHAAASCWLFLLLLAFYLFSSV